MSKVSVKIIESQYRVINMRKLKPAQVGVICTSNSEYFGHIVMRHPDPDRFQVIDMSDLEEDGFWHSDDEIEDEFGIEVRLLNKGEKVTIEIEGE